MSTWQYRLVRWARAISYTFFPILGLVFGHVIITLFDGTGWRYGLIERALPLFWLLLIYRVLVGLIHAVFAPVRSQKYQWRFLVPLFVIMTVVILNAGLEGTFPIGDVELFNLLETSVTLRTLFTAAVTLYFFVTLAWLVSDLLDRTIFASSELDRTSSTTVVTLSHYAIVAVGIISAISALGFNLSALALIGGGLSVGIGFGLQELIANFISGILLLFERTVRPGDMIEVGGQTGVVDKLRMRSTVIRTFDNTEIFVPNKNLLTSSFTAYTQSDRIVRRILSIGVSYSSDPTQVRSILQDVANRHGLVLKKPEPVVFFLGFGSSSLDFQLMVWVGDPMNGLRVASDLYFMIWNEFEKYDIEIPYPQQDLHLRSGPWDRFPTVAEQNGVEQNGRGARAADHALNGARAETVDGQRGELADGTEAQAARAKAAVKADKEAKRLNLPG
ncbi:MAG: mechanosensitive ion channel, partial [Caldilineaceae bacterium]|nr:mechanosensitive ion channel [Caldilineaceae bacterium]